MKGETRKKDTPSPDQEKAIHLTGTSLLVSAAAGSGKTFTLVERIVESVRAARYNIDELLVVTFTNAAAAEMRERIEKKLVEEARTNPDILKQIVRLPNAAISTLHSFCQSLIRQNFTALDLDPKFRLGGEQEIRLMKGDVMEELFEKKYAEGGADFLAFVSQYGTDRDDETLHDMVLSLYEFSRSQPNPDAWLDSLSESFDIKVGACLKDTPWFEEAAHDIARVLAGAADKAGYFAKLSVKKGCGDYEETLQGDRGRTENLMALLKKGAWDALRDGLSEKFSRLPSIRGGDKDAQQEIKDGRDEIKKAYARLAERYFFASEEEMLEDLRSVRSFAQTLSELTKDFAQAFQKAKKKKAMLDFDDLEHYALDLLIEKDAQTGCFTGEGTDIAKRLREKYKEVMVDEYQDTNGVQEMILQCIQSGKNAFVVGDVKQSIYRFRLADPNLFLQKQENYSGHPNEGQALVMKENYRSRPEVLGTVNFLFSQFMVKPEMEIDYDEDAALYAKADYGEPPEESFDGSPTEFILIDTDDAEDEDEGLEGFELEARVIAQRLLALKEEKRQVFDKDLKRYRPIRWKDMAILLRAVRGKAQTLVEAMRALGVPVYAVQSGGYFEEIEVRLMLALLAVIDNAHQDIPLAAVLRSPVTAMTAEELAEIRSDTPQGDLFTALFVSKNPKAVKFREKLTLWRRISRRVGVPELLHTLYLDTGYYDYVGAQPGGAVRQANLRMLADRADDYEKTSFRGLFRFLQFIRQMQKRETDLSSARTLGENEDVVRVMSVHMSKGLEFPVVVLADIGKKFNMTDTVKELPMHRELGIGPYCTQLQESVRWRFPTFARQAVSARLARESKAEEMRILYVAMTRAREKLILTAHAGKIAKKASKWVRSLQYRGVRLPGHIVLEANTWIDWIAPAIMRDAGCGERLRNLAGYSTEVPSLAYDADALGKFAVSTDIRPAFFSSGEDAEDRKAEWTEDIREQRPLPETKEGRAKKKILDWTYPYVTGTPSKFTVTEVKDRMQVIEREDEIVPELFADEMRHEESENGDFPLPEFMKSPGDIEECEVRKLRGTSYGTLMHRVLEKMDYTAPCDEPAIKKAVGEMCSEGLLTAEECAAVKISSLAAFFASDIGRRMRAARAVYKERSFSMLVDASRFGYETSRGTKDRIFLQGVIDLFFEEADGNIVLVDYKTDRKTTPDIIRRRYGVQLALYREAIERSTQKKVKACYVYRLSDNDVIHVETDALIP